MKKESESDLDGEVGREGPGEGIVVGSAFAGGVFGGVEEERGHFEGAIDEIGVGVGGERLEEPLEGEIEGERSHVGE